MNGTLKFRYLSHILSYAIDWYNLLKNKYINAMKIFSAILIFAFLSGYAIQMQDHGSVVWFRNIKIRTM